MKTVAAISFRSNHSLSMDVEDVNQLQLTMPTQVDDKQWCCELLIRSANGTIALQLLADDPDKLQVAPQGLE